MERGCSFDRSLNSTPMHQQEFVRNVYCVCSKLPVDGTQTKLSEQSRTDEDSVRIYSYSVMLEKMRYIWVVLFSLFELAHTDIRLQLWKGYTDIACSGTDRGSSSKGLVTQTTATFFYDHSPHPELSWEAYRRHEGRMWFQYKLCYPPMATTYHRDIFDAKLVLRLPSSHDDICVDLGPLSVVSTTTQRTAEFYKKLEGTWRGDPDKLRKLFANYQTHPPSKRHYKNGKGERQGTRRADSFMSEELEKSISLLAGLPTLTL